MRALYRVRTVPQSAENLHPSPFSSEHCTRTLPGVSRVYPSASNGACAAAAAGLFENRLTEGP